MYGIDGRAELDEEVLDHLEGYRGSAPVRIGNGAADQLQLDIYGELIDSVYLYNKHGTPISHDAWSDLVADRRLGLRELGPGRRGHLGERAAAASNFTYSRLMSWVALERAIRIARQRGLPGGHRRAGRGRATRSTARSWSAAGTTGARGAFVQHYDTRRARRVACC